MWRVLIVEDDSAMREFFSASIGQSPGLIVVGAVGSVAGAVQWLTDPAHEVDVLLTDLGLPDGSGLEVIRFTRRSRPACEPLVISMFGDEDNVLASIGAGALGYIHKDSAPADIAQTILEMKAGGSPISPMIARRVLSRFHALQMRPVESAKPLAADAAEFHGECTERKALSKREQEVLELVARGFSYAEIARLQTISVHTVQSHIKNLYAKLEVNSRTEAVFEATRMGLLPRA